MKSISEIIEAIKVLEGLSKDKEVARLLEMTGAALSNHKIKGTIPYHNLLVFCYANHVSVDSLLATGPDDFMEALKTKEKTEPESLKIMKLQGDLLKERERTIALQEKLLAQKEALKEEKKVLDSSVT